MKNDILWIEAVELISSAWFVGWHKFTIKHLDGARLQRP